VTSVAFLGTGIMGAPMAANCVKAGLDVTAWNRTRSKAEAIEGVRVAGSPAEAVAAADLVVTMLADGHAVEAVIRDAIDAFPPGAVWLQMSTVGIAATERLSQLASERGIAFVDAPVVGTRQPAEQGTLTVLASGPPEAIERGRPVFDAVGSKTVVLGPVGEASRLKLVVNNWILELLGALAETLAFAEGIGVDPRTFLETIDGSPLSPPYAQVKGKMMIERRFPPSFTLSLAHKDALLVLEAAERHGLELPFAPVNERVQERAIEAGHGDEDMAAVWYGVVGDAGGT
jgi:3-hydroxyisobutyrate dehydrogenase